VDRFNNNDWATFLAEWNLSLPLYCCLVLLSCFYQLAATSLKKGFGYFGSFCCIVKMASTFIKRHILVVLTQPLLYYFLPKLYNSEWKMMWKVKIMISIVVEGRKKQHLLVCSKPKKPSVNERKEMKTKHIVMCITWEEIFFTRKIVSVSTTTYYFYLRSRYMMRSILTQHCAALKICSLSSLWSRR